MKNNTASIHDLSFQKLNSKESISFGSYKGKYLLLVNVASRCGFTPQYEGLQNLQEKYAEQIQIIGFPCNQFLFQEMGSDQKIESFCLLNYGVSFPISTKIKVKGSSQDPVYSFLTKKELNGVGDHKVTWNFNKFLLDQDGVLIDYFESTKTPKEIESLLQKKGILK